MLNCRVDIYSVTNGYSLSYYKSGEARGTWVARSWAEVLELLESIGAPDFEETAERDGTK